MSTSVHLQFSSKHFPPNQIVVTEFVFTPTESTWDCVCYKLNCMHKLPCNATYIFKLEC